MGARSRLISIGAVTGALCVAASAVPAYAGELEWAGREEWAGPGGNIEDSAGIPIWQFGMYFEDSDITKPGNVVAGRLISIGWGIYRFVVSSAIWLIDWVLGFSWLSFLTTPVTEIGAGLQQIVSRLGLMSVLLMFTAFACGLWILRGRWSLGLYELLAALVIASLAGGLLANPVGMVTGPNGYIMGSRDIGFQIADELANGGSRPSWLGNTVDEELSPARPRVEQMRQDQTARLVDTLVRAPAQTLNFGTTFAGTECEAVYNALLETNPKVYSIEDPSVQERFWGVLTSRLDQPGEFADALFGTATGSALADCAPQAALVSANPSEEQVVATGVILVGALGILLFAVLLAGAVFVAGLNVLFQSLKAIITLVTALLPGRGRGALWQTIADVLTSLIIMIFAIVFLNVYLLLVDITLGRQDGDTSLVTRFFIVDIVLIGGAIVFWRARRSLRRATERLAQAFASRPGGAPTQLPEQASWGRDIGRITRRGAALAGFSTYGLLKLRKRRRSGRSVPSVGGSATGNDGGSGGWQNLPPFTDPPQPRPWVGLDRVHPGERGSQRRRITDGRPIVADPGPTRREIGRGWRSAGPGRTRPALPPGPGGRRPSRPDNPGPAGGPPPRAGRTRRLLGATAKVVAAAATGGGSLTVSAAVSAAQLARRTRLVSRLHAAAATGRTARVAGAAPVPAPRQVAQPRPQRVRTTPLPDTQTAYRRVVSNSGQVLLVPLKTEDQPHPEPRSQPPRRGRRQERDKLQETLARATARRPGRTGRG